VRVKIAKPIRDLVESLEKLPGIGPKSAQRLTFYLLHVPQHQLDQFADALTNLKKNTKMCAICKNITEMDPCDICTDMSRDKTTIAVVEQPLDILAFEKTGKYKGVYHVLHGAINPLENIGPDELYIGDLINRVTDTANSVEEIIIGTNPTMEGEATAMYITKQLKMKNEEVKISRLGMGIPTGAFVEFADETTMTQAIEGRRTL
jgi:recombination protein RecR